MTDLTKARKQLKFWQKEYEKAYLHHKNTWDFKVHHAATECRVWKNRIEELEKTER